MAQSKPVDEGKAQYAARTFLESLAPAKGLAKSSGAAGKNPALLFKAKRIKAAHPGTAAGAKAASVSTALYYVYGEPGKNFVIVSADDALKPILAYSTGSGFDIGSMPPSTAYWLQEYEKEIGSYLDGASQATAPASSGWEALAQGNMETIPAAAKVDPLITTRWNQGNYYNALTPGKSLTGCVAVATTQIMKFWKYPARGVGAFSYVHPTYGTLSADFSANPIQWQDMPNEVNAPNWAVANLMYQVGVSVAMNYSPSSSSAWVDDADDRSRSAQLALVDHFGYKRSMYAAHRHQHDAVNWKNLLVAELDAGRPLIYSGGGTNGAHAFVCDGYDANGLFHFNWGWGGLHDGYFALTALNPGSAPGSANGFNSTQYLLLGIEPRSLRPAPEITLMDPPSPAAASVPADRPISLTVQLSNTGFAPFTGTIKAVLYDSTSKPRDLEAKPNVNMAAAMPGKTSFTFTGPPMQGLSPGKYSISILTLANGGTMWKYVYRTKGVYNHAAVQLTRPELAITAEESILLSQATVTVGQPFQVSAQLANRGTLALTGTLCAAIYDSTGVDFKSYVEIKENVSLPASLDAKVNVTFATAGIPGLTPGNYVIFVYSKRVGENWILVPASPGFSNRANLRVVAPSTILSGRPLPGSVRMDPEPWSGSILLTSRQGLVNVQLLDVSGHRTFAKSPAPGTQTLRIPGPTSGTGPLLLRVQTPSGVTVRRLAPEK